MNTVLFFHRRYFGHYFAFVVQFAFTYMSTVTQVCFTGCAVCTKRGSYSFVMGSALGTSLLTVSAFGVWHISTIKI
jgi:hypothetical protein